MVLILGFVAVTKMDTNLLPDVSTPYLMVVTVYPGASPERVESEVSDVLENALTVPGVSDITATSAENYSLLLMKFVDDTDMNSAMVKVSNKLDQAKSDLPSTCLTPSVIEYSLNMNAFMTVAVSREGADQYELSEFIQKTLVPELQRRGGVSSVSSSGLVDKMVQVQLNQDKINDINAKLLELIDTQLAAAREQLEAAESDEEYNQLSKSFRETQWKNKAITELYYPGSVFKLVTAAAALDSGVMTPNSSFYCGGHLQVSNISYSCAASTEGGTTTVHGMQQMEQALNNSCNVYFIQTGQALGVSRFYDYFNAFGFTETTGVDLPSETPYLLYYTPEKEGTHSKMGEVELASSSFGQAQKITPLQMVTAAAAVVNGGYLVTPHVVDHIVDANGNTVKTVETKIKRQVISEQVSEQMRTMMEYVVGGGQSGHSGRNAYVAGYRIGGKSGTSEQLDMELRSYDGDYRKVSSFLAVLPIDDPQIVVFAMLDDPQGENDYASRIAAPIVSNIISEAAPYLGLSTDGTSQSGTVKVPNSVGQDWALAQVELNKLGLSHRLIGHSGSVTYQYPLAYSEVPAGSTIYLYTESAEGTVTTVPNVIGKNTEQAKQMLKAANLNASVPTGGSVVTAQSISAEQQVTLGTVVELQTADPEPEPESEPETESSDEEQAEQQE